MDGTYVFSIVVLQFRKKKTGQTSIRTTVRSRKESVPARLSLHHSGGDQALKVLKCLGLLLSIASRRKKSIEIVKVWHRLKVLHVSCFLWNIRLEDLNCPLRRNAFSSRHTSIWSRYTSIWSRVSPQTLCLSLSLSLSPSLSLFYPLLSPTLPFIWRGFTITCSAT